MIVRTDDTEAIALIQEVLSDELRADGTETALGQIAPRLQHPIFDRRLRPRGGVGSGRAIGPIDPIQPLSRRPFDPLGDRGNATWNCRATARRDWPRRTAATMSRRCCD